MSHGQLGYGQNGQLGYYAGQMGGQMGGGQMGAIMDTVKTYWTNYKWYIVAAAGAAGFLFLTPYGKKLLKRSNPRRKRHHRRRK